MSKILICILIIVRMFLPQQSKLDKMQGIWEDLRNGYDVDSEFAFLIINANRSVSIGYVDKDNSLGFFMIETIEGFLDYNPISKDEIHICDLKEDGIYYFGIFTDDINNGGYFNPNHGFCANINIDDDMMVISSNGEQRYNKISHLPSHANYLLYRRGKREKKDYMRAYLDANICKLVFDSVQINPLGKESRDTTLRKGELVEIISVKDSVVLVNHVMRNDELIQGWLPKNAVEKTTFYRTISAPKTYIYSSPSEQTKMYLIEGDEIELIAKEGDFWKMKYTTAKGRIIEGYIKRIDCI